MSEQIVKLSAQLRIHPDVDTLEAEYQSLVEKFRTQGLDLVSFYTAPLELNVAPSQLKLNEPMYDFKAIDLPTGGTDDFAFFPCRVIPEAGNPVFCFALWRGDKSKHQQKIDLFCPAIFGIENGLNVVVELDPKRAQTV